MPSPRVTVTFRVPKVLNQNLRAYSVQHELTQNDVAVKAIAKFLTEEGIKVNTSPRFYTPNRRSRQLTHVA